LKTLVYFLLFSVGCILSSTAQNSDDTAILKTVLQRYYKTEKPVYKGRSQLLYLYCDRANNNEELVEAIQGTKIPSDFKHEIRAGIADLSQKDWLAELDAIYETDHTNLKQKISQCLDLEKYHEISRRLNLNNQRLMIISKPLYYSKSNIALVKVTFYRNIEHNNGSVLLLEKTNGNWIIKDYLNPWST
jgi:hypothetical protein